MEQQELENQIDVHHCTFTLVESNSWGHAKYVFGNTELYRFFWWEGPSKGQPSWFAAKGAFKGPTRMTPEEAIEGLLVDIRIGLGPIRDTYIYLVVGKTPLIGTADYCWNVQAYFDLDLAIAHARLANTTAKEHQLDVEFNNTVDKLSGDWEPAGQEEARKLMKEVDPSKGFFFDTYGIVYHVEAVPVGGLLLVELGMRGEGGESSGA